MSENNVEDREDITYGLQEEYIIEHFGKEAAENANYGWFVDEVDETISTKVYGVGILTTSFKTFTHEFEYHA